MSAPSARDLDRPTPATASPRCAGLVEVRRNAGLAAAVGAVASPSRSRTSPRVAGGEPLDWALCAVDGLLGAAGWSRLRRRPHAAAGRRRPGRARPSRPLVARPAVGSGRPGRAHAAARLPARRPAGRRAAQRGAAARRARRPVPPGGRCRDGCTAPRSPCPLGLATPGRRRDDLSAERSPRSPPAAPRSSTTRESTTGRAEDLAARRRRTTRPMRPSRPPRPRPAPLLAAGIARIAALVADASSDAPTSEEDARRAGCRRRGQRSPTPTPAAEPRQPARRVRAAPAHAVGRRVERGRRDAVARAGPGRGRRRSGATACARSRGRRRRRAARRSTTSSIEPAARPGDRPELAAARTRLGLTVDQLADRTRIRPHVIESIEVDDFAPCGGDFYARGHLRTLARVLGIDVGAAARDVRRPLRPRPDQRRAGCSRPSSPPASTGASAARAAAPTGRCWSPR